MTRKTINSIVLIEEYTNSFYRKLKGHDEVYLYEGGHKEAKKLPHDFIDAVDFYSSNHKAKKNVDEVYSQYVSNSEIDTLESVISDKRSNLIIKKELLEAIAKVFLSFILADKFLEKYKIKGNIDFIPKNFSYEIYQILKQKQGIFSSKVCIPYWYLRKLRRQEFVKQLIFKGAVIFYPFVLSFFMWGRKSKDKKSYKWGLHIWNTYVGSVCQSFVKTLIKENRIARENLLYVVDGKMAKTKLAKIRADGFNYCSFDKLMKGFNFWQYIKEVLPLAMKKQKMVYRCASKKALLARIYFRTLRSYIFWEMFSKKYHVNDLIFIQDAGETAHVLLQKLYGSKTTFIYLSSCYLPLEVEGECKQSIIQYSFMPHDRFLSSQISIDFFKENNANDINEYKNVGILFSDAVFRIRQKETLRKTIKKGLGIPENKIIISYFDTPIGRLGWFSDAEGAQMIEDVLKLLDSYKDYFLIYKPKKDYQRFSGNKLMQDATKKLIESERIYCIDKKQQKGQTQDIMGISDLVISAFSSSAGFEAVVGGTKNIYYAPNDRYASNVFRVNNFPKFCAYGYEQLEDYVGYWINQCGESDFRYFQEQYIKKYADTYCDGMAFDRLEKMLKKEETISS